MSEAGRVYESLSGPLTSKAEAQVDGVMGLGEVGPGETSAHTAGGGSSSAKSGVETHDPAADNASQASGIARRSASHYLDSPSK
ncbi:MAG TPA: hypothetical protein VIX90_00315 [Edaphobacter sp.]